MAMQLTAEQQAMLNGEQGEVMAKVMKTLVMYGETFGAERMVPVTSEKGHLVTSFGLKMMTPVFDLMDQLLNAGVTSKQKFSVDPKPFDPAVPSAAHRKPVPPADPAPLPLRRWRGSIIPCSYATSLGKRYAPGGQNLPDGA